MGSVGVTAREAADSFRGLQQVMSKIDQEDQERQPSILNEEMYYAWFGGDRTKGESSMVGNRDFLSEGLEAQLENEKTEKQIIAENWKIIRESPHKYESWGLECPVVLIEKSPSEYQAWCIVTDPMTHLKTWHIKKFTDMYRIREQLTKWNYNTRKCPCEEELREEGIDYKPLKRKLDV